MEIDEEAESGVMGKRKGTPIISLAPDNNDKITIRKTRTHGDLRQHYQSDGSRLQHSGSSYNGYGSREGSMSEQNTASRGSSLTLDQRSTTDQSSRTISLSTAFAELSLTPRKPSGIRHRPSLERIKEEISPSKIPKYACTPTLRHAQSAQTLRTPSPTKQKPSRNGLNTPMTSARRKKDPLPLPVFLTKEKLTSVPAWDTKGRLEDMVSTDQRMFEVFPAHTVQENLYAMLRSQFSSAADSKNALEESLSVYKTRGLLSISSWRVIPITSL